MQIRLGFMQDEFITNRQLLPSPRSIQVGNCSFTGTQYPAISYLST